MRLSEKDIDLGPSIQQGTPPVIQRKDATFEQVHELLKEDPDNGNRSQYQWFRLPNGELIIGFYPQADMYFAATEHIDI